jgi:hypothetical protein
MSEPTAYCPTCKKQVTCLVEGSTLYCPDCWNNLGLVRTGAKTEIRTEKFDFLEAFLTCLRFFFIGILVLAAFFLVLLAFVFAACSHMGGI